MYIIELYEMLENALHESCLRQTFQCEYLGRQLQDCSIWVKLKRQNFAGQGFEKYLNPFLHHDLINIRTQAHTKLHSFS